MTSFYVPTKNEMAPDERAELEARYGLEIPVLLIDGLVAGVWHQRRSGRKIAITVEPLQPLTTAQSRGLDEQVEWLGTFLDAAPHLTNGKVEVGPHA